MNVYLRIQKYFLPLKRLFFSGDIRFPAAVALAAAGASATGCGLLPPVWGIVLVAVIPFLRRKTAVIYSIALAATIFSAWIQGDLFIFNDTDPGLPERKRARLTLHLDDRRLNSVQGVDAPSLIRAKIINCVPKIHTPARDHCFIRLPKGVKTPPYGTIIEAEATLAPPGSVYRLYSENSVSGRLYESGAGFKRFLAARDADTIALIDSGFKSTGHRSTSFSPLLKIRDILLEKNLSGKISDANRQLSSALFFGASGGMTPKLRRSFASSGTIHLFAVSGLHVGMLALLASFTFSLLPFRTRHVMIAATVWFYVFITGANPPVFRAGVMISTACLLRGFLFQVPLTDLLGYAAAFLLLSNPVLIGDTGFQYSFIITWALLLFSENHREFTLRLRAEEELIPNFSERRKFRSSTRFAERLSGAAAVTATAFLAGAGISMINQDMFIPGAVFANMLITPLLPILFIILFFKLLAGSVFVFCDELGAALIDFAFNVISGITEIFASIFNNIPVCRPSATAVAIYTAGVLLFLIFLKRDRRIAICSGAVSVSILLSLIIRVHLSEPVLLAISGDSATPPVIAIASPGTGEAAVINLPDHSSAQLLTDALSKRGVHKIKRLAFDAPYSNRNKGLPAITDRLELKTIQLPPVKDGQNLGFLSNIEEKSGREDAETIGSGNPAIKIISYSGGKKKRFSAKIQIPGAPMATVSSQDLDNGRKISLTSRSGKSGEYLLPWSSELNLLELPLL